MNNFNAAGPADLTRRSELHADDVHNTYLIEVAWEVVNQVGGIYTVIRSKVPSTVEKWGDHYCLVGPYFQHQAAAAFDPVEDYNDPIGQAVKSLREKGFEVHYGHWLVSGRPKVILLNHYSMYGRLADIKYELWEHHDIGTPDNDDLIHQVICFGYMVKALFNEINYFAQGKRIIGHFHEWMGATGLPGIRRGGLNVTTVFTTHATLLGRYLAMNDPNFYDRLPQVDWMREARHFNVETIAKFERAAAHGCHVFTTVSEVTAKECVYLLGREPDIVLPNGLNIERFVALHEFQNLHLEYKLKIHQFVMGHFFHSYKFDLDKTLYFFTSGRYEYKNKGFDITLEALARLNHKMQRDGIDRHVVMFFITKQPYYSINPSVLQSRAMLAEIKQICDAIKNQIGERMFLEVTGGMQPKLPALNDFVDEYWKLRLRRTIQAWKTNSLPVVVTHNLVHDDKDEILQFLRSAQLINKAADRVKIVYHPDFVTTTNPLFGMDYTQFVRGCHLGVFPSYYEPWGYTPLESIASGVPTITSDLAGFGDYVMNNLPNHEENGVYVVHRRNRPYQDAAEELSEQMYNFVKLSRRERITQRNRTESTSVHFDWQNLGIYYDKAYNLALSRLWMG